MKRSRSRWGRWRGWNGVYVALVLCALGGPAWAGADGAPEAGQPVAEDWRPVGDDSLEQMRGGVKVGGLDVSMDVLVRDLVDGREVQLRSFALGATGADGLVLPLINQRDGALISRDATLHVRIPGYRRAFGASSASRVRARIQRSLR